MQTLAVVGYSNTGKTTVVRQLAIWFRQQGVKLAVLKHASHGYQLDAEGKDSQSYYADGAEVVAVAGPESFSIHRRTPHELALSEILEYLGDCELVLVEGYKRHPGPKVELFRQGFSEQRLPVEGVVAIITDCPDLMAPEPIYSYQEVERLAEYLFTDVLGLNHSLRR